MSRLTIAYIISLVLALVMGMLAAEHKRFAAVFYPLFDIGQAVPILALFPILFGTLSPIFGASAGLEITAITMLILDMIWYMFLNVVSAIRNIPSEIREVSRLFGFKGLRRVVHVVIPSILPAIVTGSILSWGTGWNTIIFAEYMPYKSEQTGGPLSIPGLGSYLDEAGYTHGNTILLIFLLGIIAAIVILMEMLVWRRLLRKFEKYRVEV
ncbi:MAG: ABC transporter permease subunit [Candidatus Bathyarchaeia archaeon]